MEENNKPLIFWQPPDSDLYEFEGKVITEEQMQKISAIADSETITVTWCEDAAGYLLNGKDGFRINQEMVNRELEKFAEANRTYAVTADQVLRRKHSVNVLDATLYQIKQSGIDIGADSMVSAMVRKQLLSPFISWIGYPRNCYDLNYDWILTGKLERK